MGKAMWFVRSKGCILARNGKWYKQVAGVDDIKTYSSEGRVTAAMRRIRVDEWEATALYPGDEVDVCGVVARLRDRRPTTLDEWATKHRSYVATHESRAVVVYCDHKGPAESELYGLSDYLVSTRSGPCVWMVPRKGAVMK